jgi:hypothetical protein
MQQVVVKSEQESSDLKELIKATIAIPAEIWHRAKVQAARQKKNMGEFSVSAVEFYVHHLEEEWKREVRAESRKKAS